MVDLKAQKPAHRYAQALFEAVSNKDLNRVFSEIQAFLTTLEESRELREFLFHPVVSLKDKKDVVLKITNGFDSSVINFLNILLDNGRLDCLDEIEIFLKEKANEKNNVTTATVTLAFSPNEDLKNIIKSRLEQKLQSTVEIEFKEDKAILGGVLIKIQDTVYDLSVKGKLENFKIM